MPTLLVRYGELALKSAPVRREFERTLRRNILEQFLAARIECRLRADHGHLYVETDQPEAAVPVLRRVFGVTSVSPAVEVPSDLAAMRDLLPVWADSLLRPGTSFAIRARRTGGHPFSSQDVAREMGRLLLTRWPDRHLTVDLGHPQLEIFIEVRGPRTYLYADRLRGPGGLPLGVAGRLVALVDGPRGALGAYLMMKRGCRTALAATAAGESLAREILARFDPRCTVQPLGDSTADVARSLQVLAQNFHADGVVLPLTVDEFPAMREAWGDVVLFSPTVGFREEEVEERWTKVRELAV
jgi:thiamine biosynthesis protein ThiI